MIFSTQSQLNCVLIFVFAGMLIGILANIIFAIFLKNYQKYAIKLTFSTIFYAFFSVFYIFILNIFNYGNFSIVLLLSYLAGFQFTNWQLKKLVVIFEKAWYNKLNKIYTNLKSKLNKRKTKERKINEISSKS